MLKLPLWSWIHDRSLWLVLILTCGATILMSTTNARQFIYFTPVLAVLSVLIAGRAEPVRNKERQSSHEVRLRYCIFSALVSVLVMIAYSKVRFGDFVELQYDDSYVTYRYAANLVNGDGLRFNIADNSNSASSLMFVILLSIGKVVTPFELPTIATALNLAGLFLLVFMPGVLIARILGTARASVLMVSTGVCLGVFPPLVYWTFSGMETTFFIGLLTSAISLSFLSRDMDGAPNPTLRTTYALVLVLLTLTRVEGAVAATVIGVVSQFYALRPLTLENLRRFRAYALAGLAPTVFGLQLLFYDVYYGSPISDPVRFKEVVNYYSRTMSDALATVSTFLFDVWKLPSVATCAAGLLMLGVMRQSESRLRHFLSLNMFTFAILFSFILRSPHSDERRYELVLLVPVLLALIGLGVWMIEDCDRRSEKNLANISLVALSGLFVVTAFTSQREAAAIHARVDTYMYVQQARADAAEWLNIHSKSGSIVMSSDIGALSYFNLSNHYLDTAGLVNRTQLNAVLNRRDIYEAMKMQRPEYLVDTVTLDGVSGVEQILSNPLSYYTQETGAWSSCTTPPLFKKTVLARFPDHPPANLQIEISRVEWNRCGSK